MRVSGRQRPPHHALGKVDPGNVAQRLGRGDERGVDGVVWLANAVKVGVVVVGVAAAVQRLHDAPGPLGRAGRCRRRHAA